MENKFTVVSWNCHRAKSDSKVWEYLLELNPDVALLQEVISIPKKVQDKYASFQQLAVFNNGSYQKFSTAILVQGKVGEPILLSGLSNWIDFELELFSGNIICRELIPDNGSKIKAVSVYNPAWPIDPKRLVDVDLSGVRLKQNKSLWIADILWASLKYHNISSSEYWIIGGDFNLSETFDKPNRPPRGNKEYLDRMISLGLTECLRKSKGILTPTFRNTQGGAIKHQMDHMFVTEVLANKLVLCDTGSIEEIFTENLSDHLPLIAHFQI